MPAVLLASGLASLGVARPALAQTEAIAEAPTVSAPACPLVGALAPSPAAVTIGSVQGITNAVPATGYTYPSPLPTSATSQEPLAWPARYGQSVTVHGIVTAMTADSSRGFYLQDCGDGNADSSDAVFVFTGATSLPPEQIGDVVEVTGRVGVFFGQTQITQTSTAQRVKKGTAPLPTPVEIDVPNTVISPDALLYFERLEGMRVRVSAPRVVGGAFRLPGSSAETTTFYVVDSDDAGELVGRGQLPLRSLGGDQVDYNPEAIEVADDATVGAGSITPLVRAGTYPGMPPVVVGDTCTDLVGVINYSFNSYKLFPTTDPESVCTVGDKPTVGSAAVRGRAASEISIASFNVENLFPVNTPLSSDTADACTSAPDAGPCYSESELDTKLAKLAIGLVDELRCPDVVMVEETYSEAILSSGLVPLVAARGCPYVAKSFPTFDARGIEVGVLYRTDRRLAPISVAKMPTQQCGGVDPFLTPSAGREPLVATFDSATGQRFTVIGNHWKSKGGDDALFAQTQPPTRSTEDQRKCQAQAVRSYLDTLPAATKVIVVGDFNDFSFPEPGEGVDPITILRGVGGAMPLTESASASSYSYNFSGRSQTIDHVFLSPTALALKTGDGFSPLNSDYGDVWRADPTIGHGASDHNPDVVFLALEAPNTGISAAGANGIGGAMGSFITILGALGLATAWQMRRRSQL